MAETPRTRDRRRLRSPGSGGVGRFPGPLARAYRQPSFPLHLEQAITGEFPCEPVAALRTGEDRPRGVEVIDLRLVAEYHRVLAGWPSKSPDAGCRVALGGLANFFSRGFDEPLAGAVVAPRREVVSDGAPGQQVEREQLFLAAGTGPVGPRLTTSLKSTRPHGSPARLRERDERLEGGPIGRRSDRPEKTYGSRNRRSNEVLAPVLIEILGENRLSG